MNKCTWKDASRAPCPGGYGGALGLRIAGMAVVAAAVLAVMLACPNPENSAEPADSMGQVCIRLDASEMIRGARPNQVNFARYTLHFVPGDGAEGLELSLDVKEGDSRETPRTETVTLRPESWTIIAEGWETSGEGGVPAALVKTAVGSAAVQVEAGKTAAVELILKQAAGETGSTGTLVWELRFPAPVVANARIDLSILDGSGKFVPYEQFDVTVSNGSKTGSKVLPAGYYRVDFSLPGSSPPKGRSLVAQIQPGLETRLSPVVFQAGDAPETEGLLIAAENPAALGAALAALPENTPETPYRAAVSGVTLNGKASEGGRLLDLYNAINRYVELDLSECTGSGFSSATSGGRAFIVGIRLPETVQSITGSPFASYSVLAWVEMPGVTGIAKDVFKSRSALRSVTLGATPPTLGENAFPSGLLEIRVPAGAAGTYRNNADPAWTAELKALVREE